MNFFVDLTKSLLSPKALKGFIIGLFIGALSVGISILIRAFIEDPNYEITPVLGQVVGAFLVALYGYLSASKNYTAKYWALFLFFIAGLLGFFLIRLVIETHFSLSPSNLNNNIISYAISCGIACALAGGFFETITQSE